MTMDNELPEVKKLAEEHWNYIEELLKTHNQYDSEESEVYKFHYISAFVHGYRHAMQDFNCVMVNPEDKILFAGSGDSETSH